MLRARRLKQLINGYQEGSKRKTGPKSCRVSMVFDNSDRFLAIEKDRVTFTKGIRLRGKDTVTYYLLDGIKSSATEFEALFSRAGLYATGYNIIQQGDVTQTSLMSGTERRRKIEDVAGITAYDNRLRKTRSARNSVETDLTLLNERAKEAKRTLNQLEREKLDAEKLEKIIEEIKENELLHRFRMVFDLEAEIESRREVVDRYTKELEELEKEQGQRNWILMIIKRNSRMWRRLSPSRGETRPVNYKRTLTRPELPMHWLKEIQTRRIKTCGNWKKQGNY